MNSDQIRKRFLDFFQARGHRIIPSSPLVPHGDPTLLFTSAGMVQFKPYFMGKEKPPAPRMASVQKCFRTSDIDEVGDDTHLTFFEMLGNFSVGDYFKKEAIEWAWELLTDPKEQIALPKERLWVSVYEDDEEAYGYWRARGVPEDHIEKNGEEENYWFSGDVGPCGPCSEIHYDFGKTPGCKLCDADKCHPAVSECGRFTELWNLVFTMYFQNEDGSRSDLPQKNIDTGAGLERWASVLQGKRNVYDTDLFRPIIARIEDRTYLKYDDADDQTKRAMRIIAEHARAVAFLIADGVMPANEGRGYVLRRLLRRAIYFAHGRTDIQVMRYVVEQAIEQMWPFYHGLREQAALISELVAIEEERFSRTMVRGEAVIRSIAEAKEYYQQLLADAPLGIAAARQKTLGEMYFSTALPETVKAEILKPYERVLGRRWWKADPDRIRAAAQGPVRLTGGAQFVLWDTYGYPPELSTEVAAKYGISVDPMAEEDFKRLMEEQRERARAAGRFRLSEAESAEAYATLSHLQPRFTGYDTLSQQTSVAGIIAGGAAVDSVEAGDEAEIVLFETPFYAEQGGQVGDSGEIVASSGRFRVEDTQRTESGLSLHRGRIVEGRIAVNDDVTAQVDADRRWDIMRNHTATHLLHAALRRVLGPHARQSGSLVAPERLRFDFTHVEALKPEELSQVERLVNEKIRENLPVRTQRQSYEEATAGGATALFDEKYAAEVRVVEVIEDSDRYSAELCGGTHVHATGDIGQLVIITEESVGAGLRRIEALTGRGAEGYVRERLSTLRQLRDRLGVTGDDRELVGRVDALFQEVDSLKKRVQALEREIGRNHAESLLAEAEHVDGRALLSARVPASSPEALREIGDWLRERLGSGVIVLGTVVEGRPSLLAMVTPDLAARGLHAGELVKKAAEVTGGGGGGRPEMAQAGGRDASRLDEALRLAKELAVEKIRGLKDS
ncbi:MAG: alanine--tRNA ligase [Dehalococcoidia bacterium]